MRLAWDITSLPGMLDSIINSVKYPTCLWATQASVFRYIQNLQSLGVYGVVMGTDREPQKPVLWRKGFCTRPLGFIMGTNNTPAKDPPCLISPKLGSAGTQQHRLSPEHAGVHRCICLCPNPCEEVQSFFYLVGFNAILPIPLPQFYSYLHPCVIPVPVASSSSPHSQYHLSQLTSQFQPKASS